MIEYMDFLKGNADYFRDGVRYLQAADAAINMPTLFDFLEEVT